MNIIESKNLLVGGGSNLKEVISDVVDDLAKMILMVESGRRYFVNGEIQANHEPFFVKQLGYCTINISVRSADLIILAPKDVDFSTCVALLIGRVNDRLHDLEALLPGRDAMLKNDNVFADIREEYTRTVDSLIMPKGARNQVMKRIFVLDGDTRERMPETAFRWNILHSIKSFPHTRPESIWLADKADVYVNLIGAPLGLFTSHKQLQGVQRVLEHLGVKKITKYFMRSGQIYTSGGAILLDKYIPVTYSGAGGDTIRVFGMNSVKHIQDKFMHLPRQTLDGQAPMAIGAQAFFDSFMEQKHELGASHIRCQMCLKDHSGQMYALEKIPHPDTFAREYAAICRKCMCNDQVFADATTLVKIITYSTGLPFSAVSESHGIPRSHALLAESKSFANSHYVRDKTSVAFGAVKVSIKLLTFIIKFRSEVPDGEFIIFNQI